MNACMDFFEANRDNRQKVKDLIATGQGDAWAAQSLTASPWSPRPIRQGEVLARQVHSPLHWDTEAKEVKLGFFDDLTNKGLSVNRLDFAKIEALSDDSRARAAAGGKNEAVGFVCASVRDLVATMCSVQGGTGAVFDTAKEDDQSHADLCQTSGAKAEGRAMRQALFQALKKALIPG